MAALDDGEDDLYAGFTEDAPWSVPLVESDGTTPAELAAGDVVHCVLSSRDKEEPVTILLHLTSDDETDNHSRVEITATGNANTGDPAEGFVRFAQADTQALVDAWDAGIVSKRVVMEMYYVDASETDPADAEKIFLRKIIHLHRRGRPA